MHFHSAHPVTAKRAVLTWQVKRARRVSSDIQSKKKSLQTIRSLFKSNGYPFKLIDSVIQRECALLSRRRPTSTEGRKGREEMLISNYHSSMTTWPQKSTGCFYHLACPSKRHGRTATHWNTTWCGRHSKTRRVHQVGNVAMHAKQGYRANAMRKMWCMRCDIPCESITIRTQCQP